MLLRLIIIAGILTISPAVAQPLAAIDHLHFEIRAVDSKIEGTTFETMNATMNIETKVGWQFTGPTICPPTPLAGKIRVELDPILTSENVTLEGDPVVTFGPFSGTYPNGTPIEWQPGPRIRVPRSTGNASIWTRGLAYQESSVSCYPPTGVNQSGVVVGNSDWVWFHTTVRFLTSHPSITSSWPTTHTSSGPFILMAVMLAWLAFQRRGE